MESILHWWIYPEVEDREEYRQMPELGLYLLHAQNR
jgi:hypothetical protein